MILNLQMHLVLLCLLVINCCVCVKSEDDFVELNRAQADGSSDRQFINSIKKWFSRSEETERMKNQTTEKTKIKYLPVYVPYPVQVPFKMPSETGYQYYGAYQDQKKKNEDYEFMYQGLQTLPNPHASNYELPFSGHVPKYVRKSEYAHLYAPMQHHLSVTYPHQLQSIHANSYYGNNDYLFDSEELEDEDSEVVENSELLKSATKNSDKRGKRLRKVKRKTNKRAANS